jgi:Pyruvate/2-oxoglutarate dehydrogenase complex, dehydrogenase (E1) component, eukaryotic type, beta subunit
MPKELFIDPEESRKKGKITFQNIPLNQYGKRMKDVKDEFTKEELVDIFSDMLVIREFEKMIEVLRQDGNYCGIAYDYSGPAHLGIGQESTAVGQAVALDNDDIIFGHHRSHGELIARGFRAIRTLNEERVQEVMQEYSDGVQYRIISDEFDLDVQETAKRFYIYGIMCEIFGKKNGFAQGLGNSIHAFFLPFGFYPNNAIVGGSAPIAAGAALFKKIRKQKGIVIANAGDASLGCGPVWESLNFASMGQFKTLWDDGYKGGLPILFNFVNNWYGMGGQTHGETMGFDYLARVGAGINPDQMHAERVDGYNVFAVIDATRRKKELLLAGKGPALLDTITYRFSGHSPTDANSARSQEEILAWQKYDALTDYEAQLLENKVLSKADVDQLKNYAHEMILSIYKITIDPVRSPRMDLVAEPDSIEKFMYSNQRIPKLADDKPEVLAPKEENPRLQRIKKKSRTGRKDGKVLPSSAVVQFRDAVFEAVLDKFYEDPTLVSFGEDLRVWGSAFGIYKDLDKSIPYHRLFNSPISEATIVSASIGYAMMGGRALPEIMYFDFMGRAGDDVLNQLSKWQSMSAGQLRMPIVLRMGVGEKYGAQHSQDWSSICAHVPGLKIVFPTSPYDAKGLMNTALAGTDPVIFLECQALCGIGELFHEEGVPEGYYEIPIGEPDIKKRGSDLTILTIGRTLYRALDAAKMFEEQYGVSVEVIDARTIVPFNFEPVFESVKKTGKVILASDACQKGSILNDYAQNITSALFDYLDAPPVVIGARNWISPVAEIADHFFPQKEWFLDAYHQKIKPLKGYQPKATFNTTEAIRRSRLGV